MLTDLKFVQGAVSKKDFVPSMSHFQLMNGCIRSFNGSITISTPIDCHLVCNPRADTLVKAIGNCGDETSLTLTPRGKLSIKSGSFRAIIECFGEPLPVLEPSGQFYKIDGEGLYKALENLYPVIGEDATRPWANGLLLYGNKATATNNVVIVQMELPWSVPLPINIPKQAIKELLRVKEYPAYIQLTKDNVTFHYAQHRWIRSTLFDLGWPDITKVLPTTINTFPVPEGFFNHIEALKPFADDLGRVYINEGQLSTQPPDADAEGGAVMQVEGLTGEGIYQIEMLLKLRGFCKAISFGERGAPFEGDDLKGVIMGLRK